MNLFVIFAQREEMYEGQHAPEALEVMDAYSYEDNPDWLQEKLAEHRKNPDFVSVEIVEVSLGGKSQDAIRERLLGVLKLDGEIQGHES